MVNVDYAKALGNDICAAYNNLCSSSNVHWGKTLQSFTPSVCTLDTDEMSYLLIDSLYKKKLINEVTYAKIMSKYKGRGVVNAMRQYEWSA